MQNNKAQETEPCENAEPCEHGEHDHGICLDCGEDITQDLVMAAEYATEGGR